jgi:hypothetical protein
MILSAARIILLTLFCVLVPRVAIASCDDANRYLHTAEESFKAFNAANLEGSSVTQHDVDELYATAETDLKLAQDESCSSKGTQAHALALSGWMRSATVVRGTAKEARDPSIGGLPTSLECSHFDVEQAKLVRLQAWFDLWQARRLGYRGDALMRADREFRKADEDLPYPLPPYSVPRALIVALLSHQSETAEDALRAAQLAGMRTWEDTSERAHGTRGCLPQ